MNVEKWIEGEPERWRWFGLKTRGKTQLQVQTFRCEHCGLLKSYAPTASA